MQNYIVNYYIILYNSYIKKVFSYYLVYDALKALCDTSKGEQGEPEYGRRHMENILRWYDNMQNTIPTWYMKEWRMPE